MLRNEEKENFHRGSTFIKLFPKYISNSSIGEEVRDVGNIPIGEFIVEKENRILKPQILLKDQPFDILNSLNDRFSEENFPVRRIKDGSIITLFDKTPRPTKPTDVVCPHFYELKWANGCNFDCAWCYLNGTYRFLPRGKKPYLKNINIVLDHLDVFFKTVNNKSFLLNSGEISDSLLFENDGAPLTNKIIPKFMEQSRHKLLIVTKSTQVDNLLSINAQNHVIISFSLNSFKVADRWEKAPKVIDRIKAAQKLYNAGYIVRVRIDPMVPIKNWIEEYKSLVDTIFNHFTPERITLGSLRGLQSTINNCKDKSWTKYLTETSNWGKKVDIGHRLTMYSTVINYLKEKYGYNNVALCKETVEVWKKLNMDHKLIKCNCLL